MDGVHDMGGMDGFGKVVPEPNEPPFHEPWEGRVLAMQRAMSYAGAWQIDMSRFAQERLPPQVYLTASYYQRWALAMEKNVVERGQGSHHGLIQMRRACRARDADLRGIRRSAATIVGRLSPRRRSLGRRLRGPDRRDKCARGTRRLPARQSPARARYPGLPAARRAAAGAGW